MFLYKPNTIKIDLVQGCNRTCEFCGTNGFERKIYFAKPEVIKKECSLIRKSGLNPRIFLAGHGEPTLHPDLIKILSIIRAELPKCWIQLITNGYFIKKHGYSYIQKILEYVNDVSIDNYENKLDLIALQTEAEIFNASHLKEKCKYQELKNGVPFYAEKRINDRRILVIPDISLQEGNQYTRKFENHCGAGMPPEKTHLDKKCTFIFRQLKFRYDGNVAICCNDFRGQYFVVNVMDENIKTLEDVWHHPRLESARKVLYHLKRKAMFPCNICNATVSRVGLLPKIAKPTSEDLEIVRKKYAPLTKIVKREWEK